MKLKYPLAVYESMGVDVDRARHCSDVQVEMMMCTTRKGKSRCGEEKHNFSECYKLMRAAAGGEWVTKAYWNNPSQALADNVSPTFEQHGHFGILRRASLSL